jgi:putative ABC transport system substrate-binding protein
MLGLLGGAALWPRAAPAAEPLPVIGFLHGGSMAATRAEVAAFWQGLNQAGFAEHRTITAEYRWADGHDELLPTLAADLVHLGAAIIVAGGAHSITAAKRATQTIPVVFVSASDPLRSGIVADVSRPGGNVTGISLASPELLAERFQFLHRLVPSLTSAVALVNPEAPNIDVQLQYLSDESKRVGVRIEVIDASGETDFATALNAIAERHEAALVVANDGFLNGRRDRLVAATIQDRIPAAFANREFVEAGGLMSYGPSLIEAYRQAGTYVGRILKGERAADLPVQNPLELELAINAKIAKSLGIEIPPALMAAASEVIK